MRYCLFVFLFLSVSSFAQREAWSAESPKATAWAGAWETTFGHMALTQTGSKVSGTYLMGGSTCKIEGMVSEKKLQFTYTEPNASGEGWFELNGDKFVGQWKEKGQSHWSPWYGKRLARHNSFAGVWSTSFGRMRLIEGKDGGLRGIYSYGGGSKIEGKLKDGKLEFEYREAKANGKGWFQLDPGGNSFSGKWLHSGSQKWEEWRGDRMPPIPGRVWLVVMEAAWQNSYDPREYAFGDMLKAFFDRTRNVEVRRRPLTDEATTKKWLEELAYLPEPIVLTIAAHGESDGPKGDNGTISAKSIAEALRYVGSLKAVHFSSCLVMKGDYGRELHRKLKDYGIHVPVSGYKNSVDWALSALFEMNYFDLILSRGVPPNEAGKAALMMFPLAGTTQIKNVPVSPGGFESIY